MELRTFIAFTVDGAEVCRHEIAGSRAQISATTLEKPDDAPDLPKTLDWYRDTAKWLVTGAAAALTLGLGYFAETTEHWQRWAFTIAGVVLLIALGAGALLQHWVVEFGKLWENRALIDPSKVDEAKKNDKARERCASRSRWAYLILLLAFFSGMVAFGVTCGVRMWTSRAKQTLTVAVKKPDQELLLIDPASGEVWRVPPGSATPFKTGTPSRQHK